MLDPTVETPFEVRATVGFLALALVINTWIAYDTRGALTRLFFFTSVDPSPRMLRYFRINAGFVAIGLVYVLLSYLVGFRIY